MIQEAAISSIRNYRIPGLDLAGDFIYPNYAGQSILNIPATLCRLLGIPDFGAAGAFDAVQWSALPHEGAIQRVVLVLMDGLSYHRLVRWIGDASVPLWGKLAAEGTLLPLTSIAPSTTASALTSLWTGLSVAQHGIAGYEMWLKEYGMIVNTILQAPVAFKGDVDSLGRAGFRPESFLPVPTLGMHLKAHGIRPYAFQHRSISHSGLSRMLLKDVDVYAFHTASDLWLNLLHLVQSRQYEHLFTWVYWGEVDHFSHIYGPEDERTVAEFSSFSQALERYFIGRLDESERQRTLLILTADHGEIATPKDDLYDLRNHPGFVRRLHMLPSGESRMSYLYIRPGQVEALREYVERKWPGQFVQVPAYQAAQSGLFGPGEHHPSLMDRLGDYILVAKDNAYLWWGNDENPLVGRHGGLSEDEMLVPFLAVRL